MDRVADRGCGKLSNGAMGGTDIFGLEARVMSSVGGLEKYAGANTNEVGS